MPDLDSILERLIQNGVEFVIVGGFAATAHGSTYVTQDLEICCPFNAENLVRLGEALEGLHPFHRMTPARIPLDLTGAAPLKSLHLQTTLGQLDCIGEVSGVGPYEVVKEESEVILLESGTCRVISLDALIRAKDAAGRLRDRLTVAELRAIRERRKNSGE